MRTIGERFTRDASLFQRSSQDVKLLWRIAQMLFADLIVGALKS